MNTKIHDQPPLSFGTLIAESFRLYGITFWRTLLWALLLIGLMICIGIAIMAAGVTLSLSSFTATKASAIIITILLLLTICIVAAFFNPGLTYILQQTIQKQTVTLKETMTFSLQRFIWPLLSGIMSWAFYVIIWFLALIILFIISFLLPFYLLKLLFLLCVIAFLIWVTLILWCWALLVASRHGSIIEQLMDTLDLLKGNWWKTFGLFLVIVLADVIVALLLLVFVQIIVALSDGDPGISNNLNIAFNLSMIFAIPWGFGLILLHLENLARQKYFISAPASAPTSNRES